MRIYLCFSSDSETSLNKNKLSINQKKTLPPNNKFSKQYVPQTRDLNFSAL
jgi:hypothetical protein